MCDETLKYCQNLPQATTQNAKSQLSPTGVELQEVDLQRGQDLHAIFRLQYMYIYVVSKRSFHTLGSEVRGVNTKIRHLTIVSEGRLEEVKNNEKF